MKIKMNPIAELDGDEMTRILWRQIKETLLEPFVELTTANYDLSLPHRDETEDKVTVEAAEAIRRLHVGVKCATITPNAQRMEEYKLHSLWKSPNATIRAALDGTVFRTPIVTGRIRPYVRGWVKPITIARHAYGDVYKAVEMKVPGPGKAELVFTGEGGGAAPGDILLQGSRRPPGHAQPGRFHRELRPRLLRLRPGPGGGSVVLRQGHHLQGVRREFPGDLPADL